MLLLVTVIVIGLLKWNREQGGDGVADLLVNVVQGLADLVPRIVQWAIETGKRLIP